MINLGVSGLVVSFILKYVDVSAPPHAPRHPPPGRISFREPLPIILRPALRSSPGEQNTTSVFSTSHCSYTLAPKT